MVPETTQLDVQPIKHRCGQCNEEWLTEEEYLQHVCPVTNFTPQDPEHHGPEFAEVQKAALERGMETLQAENAPAEAVANQQAAIESVTTTEVPVQAPAPAVELPQQVGPQVFPPQQ